MKSIHDNIIIMGMKHSGKSTHGRILAEKFNESFIDTDDMIEELYAEKTGEVLSCRDIYKKKGWEYFRKLEHDSLHFIEQRLGDGENAVISLGGGLVANPELEDIMGRIGVVVYLQVPYDILYKRIVANGLPPFLESANPYERFMEVCKERESYYFKYEHLTVELGDLPVPEANELIVNTIIRYFEKI